MNAHTPLRTLTLLCATLLTVACGGSGGPSIAGIDRTGAPVTVFAFGSINGFGSIIVNGVHYDTSSSSFEIDGSPGSQDDLSVGDVVFIEGTISDDGLRRTASSVIFDDNVEGPIAVGSLNATSGTFVVLGQTIITNAGTSYDDGFVTPSFDGLAEGAIVEVSGFVNADGAIVATRIEPKPASTEFEVTGTVSTHDAGTLTFTINDLVVQYGTASVRDFPDGAINEGDLVEVTGGTTLGAGGELIATDLEFKGPRVFGDDGDEAEVEGIVTSFTSVSDFVVSGVPVTTNESTTFEGGSVSDLMLNVALEAEGEINAEGILVADEIQFRRASVVEIEGLVDSVSISNGSLTVLGITINVDAVTRIEDKRDDVEPFTLANLTTGDFVAIRGGEDPNASGEIIATRLERDDGTIDDTLLQGVVEASSEPAITILGVTIDTTGAQFRDENEQPITPTAFFTRPPDGELVKVKGSEVTDTAIDASEVELEFESGL